MIIYLSKELNLVKKAELVYHLGRFWRGKNPRCQNKEEVID
jgi:hypothetical protein